VDKARSGKVQVTVTRKEIPVNKFFIRSEERVRTQKGSMIRLQSQAEKSAESS
jgi:hypothetical protein